MRWTLFVKIRLTAVLLGTFVLFGILAYWVMPRTDPGGPVLLVMLTNRGIALALLAGLAGVVAAAAGAVLDRDLPHAGWLAVGAGWLSLAFRSPPLDHLLVLYAKGGAREWDLAPTATLQSLYLWMLAEVFVLFAVSAGAYTLSRWVGQMLPTVPDPSPDPSKGPPPLPNGPLRHLSNSAADLFSSLLGTVILSILIYSMLVSDSQERGQILFALFGGFFLAALASHQFFGPRSPWGLVAAVPLAAGLSYALTVFSGATRGQKMFAYDAPMPVALPIARPLPIDYLGMGLVAVMFAYILSVRMLTSRRQQEQRRQAEMN